MTRARIVRDALESGVGVLTFERVDQLDDEQGCALDRALDALADDPRSLVVVATTECEAGLHRACASA